MAMCLTGVGSQYLFGTKDGKGDWFDGAKTYKVTLPKGIPAEAFWSFALYDNQICSMLKTPQKYPRAGSQNDPVKGWVTLLRLYGPMPAFFDKSWQPSEIELVK